MLSYPRDSSIRVVKACAKIWREDARADSRMWAKRAVQADRADPDLAKRMRVAAEALTAIDEYLRDRNEQIG